MIEFIVGVLSGFTLCCIICWVKIKNRDDEIELLKKQNNKYKDFIDNHQFYDEDFVKKED